MRTKSMISLAVTLSAIGGGLSGLYFGQQGTPPAQVVHVQPAPSPSPVRSVSDPRAAFFASLPLCEFEDSENCFWDAKALGNGKGRSFIDLNGTAFYLDGKPVPHQGN